MDADTVINDDFVPTAKVLCDSISPAGHRLTTMEVRMHRFVLAEFNTHRTFSRGSASSRAIPVSKTINRITTEPVYPLSWPSERKGMQGGDELDVAGRALARTAWHDARLYAVHHAKYLAELGVHKSIVNRILEPFMSHTVIVSSTEWDNFWAQRCSPLAQPEIRAAAEAMKVVYDASEPALVHRGRWHLPYISDEERQDNSYFLLRRISAARCARVSYLTQDGRRDITHDLALYDRLIAADPPHASPLEHVATPTLNTATNSPGNFTGWLQLRHALLGGTHG